MTRLGKILSFGLLLKAQVLWWKYGLLQVFKSFHVQGISCRCFGLSNWAQMTFFGNRFGYFFQNLGVFFSILPVTLNAVFVDCHGLEFARKKNSFKGMCCKAINCWNFKTCNLRLVLLCCKAINCWNFKTCNLRLVFLIIKGAYC